MQLKISKPDDWHLHVRDGRAMADAVAHSAKTFARAVVMPNLVPPITTTEQARAYRRRIVDALPVDSTFQPLMTLYLTDLTTCEEIATAADDDSIVGVKLYPAGATTNSASGVSETPGSSESGSGRATTKPWRAGHQCSNPRYRPL